MQKNSILWNLESQTLNFSDKQGVIMALHEETKLEPENLENLYNVRRIN
jgi:hypothetical protein